MNKKLKIATITVVFIVLAFFVAQTVFAFTEEELVFSTEEGSESILMAIDGQKQVRLVRQEELKEIRLAEEARIAEEERLIAEAEAERKRVEEAIALKEAKQKEEAELAAKEQESKSVHTSSSETKANVQTGSNLGTFEATAYGPDCYGCSGITANGTDIRNGNIYSGGYRVIAADPRVIPMNSIVKITYSSGQTEMAKVCDTGGAIKGNIIDIAFASEAETPAFGRQQVQIELIN